jgi:DNA-binding HxlR family transcriptional regulator
MARALDVVGERWALLIVRELLLGPKRFKDLLAALPAMGANRLTERLRDLEHDGVLDRRTLPAPADGVPVYALTDRGERLRPALVCLGAWGLGLPVDDPRIDPATARAELLALGLAGTAPPELTRGVRELHEFRIGDERFHLSLRDGELIPRSGPAPLPPDVRVVTDFETFLALGAGRLTPARAVQEGRAQITGADDAVARAFAILDLRRAGRPVRVLA